VDLVIPGTVSTLSFPLYVRPLILFKNNHTLRAAMCPSSSDGKKESEKWLKIFTQPIRERLNAAAPGAHLKNKDVRRLMSLCIYLSEADMAPSPFCGLFDAEEFKNFEYYADLRRFYSYGYARLFSFPWTSAQARTLVTEGTLDGFMG
jgi:hypothetical protein